MKKIKYVFALSLLVSGLRAADVAPMEKNADLMAQVNAFSALNAGVCQDQVNAFLALVAASDSTDDAIQKSFADFLNCSQAVVVTPEQIKTILGAAANDTITDELVPDVQPLPIAGAVVTLLDAIPVDQSAPVAPTNLELAITAANAIADTGDSLSQQAAATLDGIN